jgi:hypothetical protein
LRFSRWGLWKLLSSGLWGSERVAKPPTCFCQFLASLTLWPWRLTCYARLNISVSMRCHKKLSHYTCMLFTHCVESYYGHWRDQCVCFVCLLVPSCKQLGRFGWNLNCERWQTALRIEMDIRLRIAFNSQQYASEGCFHSITSHFLIVPPSDFLTCWCWPYFVWCIFSVCCRSGNGFNMYIIHTIDRNGNPKECEWIGGTTRCNLTSGYKTWGFHSGECSDCGLLDCDTV